MSKIAICPNCAKSRARYLEGVTIPEKYMEDFTLMGFVVENYREAVSLVKSVGFMVAECDGGTEIDVTGPEQLTEIQSLLTAHKLQSVFSDIADTIYQA